MNDVYYYVLYEFIYEINIYFLRVNMICLEFIYFVFK